MQPDDGFLVLVLGVLAAVLTTVLWWHLGLPTAEPARTVGRHSSPTAPPVATAITASVSPTRVPTTIPTPLATPPGPPSTSSPTPTAPPPPAASPTPRPEPPDTARLAAALNALVAESPIEFPLGSAQLLDTADVLLARIADLLREERDGLRVLVVGHTDDQGDPLQNEELSFERARSIVNHLVANGIDERLVRADGRGGTEPIAGNGTDAGRAANRRIEFEVVHRED